jgi:tight adherence protein B
MNFRQKQSGWRQDIERKEIGLATGSGVIFICVLAYLFYSRWWMIPVLSPILIAYLFLWERETEKKKERLFCLQFKDAMQMLASALAAGYSVENSIRAAEKDLQKLYKETARIRKEFASMSHQLNMNFSAERVLKDFAARVHQEDVDNFVTVFSIAKKSGGDSISIIRNTIRMICDKIEVRQEISVLTAAKRYEFRVMTMIPLGILLYMRFSFPEFLSILYGNAVGAFVMTICLVIYGAAYLLGKKVTEIEV